MPVRIFLKNGTAYTVDAYHDDVASAWRGAFADIAHSIVTFDRLHAGIPLPKVTVDMREVASIEQANR